VPQYVWQLLALALALVALSFLPLLAARLRPAAAANAALPHTILWALGQVTLCAALGALGVCKLRNIAKIVLFLLDSIIIGVSGAALFWWVFIESRSAARALSAFTIALSTIALLAGCVAVGIALLLRPRLSSSKVQIASTALKVAGCIALVLYTLRQYGNSTPALPDVIAVVVGPLFVGLSSLTYLRANPDGTSMPASVGSASVTCQSAISGEESPAFGAARRLDTLLVVAAPCLVLLVGAWHLSQVHRSGGRPLSLAEFWWGPLLSLIVTVRIIATTVTGSQSKIVEKLSQNIGNLREQLNRRTYQLTTLHAVTADFNDTLDVERLMATALRRTGDALDAPIGAIWLRMDDANMIATQRTAAQFANGVPAPAAETAPIGSAAVLLRELERSIAERQAIESLRNNGTNAGTPVQPMFQSTGRRWRMVQVQGADTAEGQFALQILHDSLELGDIAACSEACRSRPPIAGRAHIAPIRWKGEIIGALGVVGEGEWDEDERTLVEALALEVGAALRNAQLYQEASRLADRDGLTDLLNHRTLQGQLTANLARAMRTKSEFSVVMMDVKNFKFFNDTYGHQVGDQVLRTVARCLTEATRTSDVLGRFGGDEFMAILLDTDSRGTIEVCSRIAERLAREAFQEANDGRRIPIALSFGAALYPDNGNTVMELLSAAQSNLEDAHYGNTPMLANLEKSASEEAQELRKLKEASEGGSFGVLDALVTAIDNKDRYTRRHSEDVTHWATMMGKELGFSEETQRAVRISGLLHDVGKIAVPDSILRKPGRLNDDEFQIMQQHPVFGALIVKEVPHLTEVLGGIKHHHERYDGKGYPDKLAGENIPVLGRLLAVPDCFSAMTTERPYRKALSWDEAISEINKGRGTQFDPNMADAFLKVIDRLIAEKSAPLPEATTPQEAEDNYKPNLRPRSVADAEKVA
jgi:diguanylate cyclase (GGDEF)-like protein